MSGALRAKDIISALQELGGQAPFEAIYDIITKKRGGYAPYRGLKSYRPTMWQVIYKHCKGNAKYTTGPEYFLKVGGGRYSKHCEFRLVDSLLAKTVEQLQPAVPTVEAVDVSEPPSRVLSQTYRVLRDTELARRIKTVHGCKCQVCQRDGLQLSGGKLYAEAHHIQPLGGCHAGPDDAANILCVCPNCHVLLDYGAVKLDVLHLDSSPSHQVARKYIDYHNEKVFNKVGSPT